MSRGLVDFVNKDIGENGYHRNRLEYIIAALRHYIEFRIELLAKEKCPERGDDYVSTPSQIRDRVT